MIIMNITHYDRDPIRDQLREQRVRAWAAKRQEEERRLDALFEKWNNGTATIDDEDIII